MPKTVHAKVLRSHPDFSHHPGEVVELSDDTFEKYTQNEGFFRKATAEEVEAASATLETATVPQADEQAVVPAAAPKTPEEAAKLLEKGAKKAEKDAKK